VNKKKITGGKSKMTYITGDKVLLTLYVISCNLILDLQYV